jgi:hypothetical protein
MLSRALALVIGTEVMVVFKDVLQVSDTEARKVRLWAIRALVEAAGKKYQAPLPLRRDHGSSQDCPSLAPESVSIL